MLRGGFVCQKGRLFLGRVEFEQFVQLAETEDAAPKQW
jgi:hypothetical protein